MTALASQRPLPARRDGGTDLTELRAITAVEPARRTPGPHPSASSSWSTGPIRSLRATAEAGVRSWRPGAGAGWVEPGSHGHHTARGIDRHALPRIRDACGRVRSIAAPRRRTGDGADCVPVLARGGVRDGREMNHHDWTNHEVTAVEVAHTSASYAQWAERVTRTRSDTAAHRLVRDEVASAVDEPLGVRSPRCRPGERRAHAPSEPHLRRAWTLCSPAVPQLGAARNTSRDLVPTADTTAQASRRSVSASRLARSIRSIGQKV